MEAKEYQRLAAIEDSHWWYRAMHELVDNVCKSLTFASQKSDFKILDAGCGSGGLTKKLERFGQVAGTDVSLLPLKLGQRRKFNAIQGSVNQLPFKKEQFMLVTSISVLCQLGVDDLNSLKQMHRVLKPGGKIIIILPAFKWVWSRHDEAVHSRRRYNLKDAIRIVGKSGFKIVGSRYIFSFLFPAFLVKRFTERLFPNSVTPSDLEVIPGFLNNFLFWLCRVEWRMGKYIKLPFGSSLLVVGEKE